MRIRGTLSKGLLVALVLSLIPIVASSAQKVTPGAACKTSKQKVIYGNKIYTCTKSGKKLLWSKGVVVPKPSSNPSSNPSPNPSTVSAELTAGLLCNSTTQAVVKVVGSTLYCVRHADGTTKFIGLKDQAPTVSNPVSPEKMSACQPPDLRNGIPNGNFRWAITYPATPVTLVNKGTLKMSVVPIDFTDVPATTSA